MRIRSAGICYLDTSLGDIQPRSFPVRPECITFMHSPIPISMHHHDHTKPPGRPYPGHGTRSQMKQQRTRQNDMFVECNSKTAFRCCWKDVCNGRSSWVFRCPPSRRCIYFTALYEPSRFHEPSIVCCCSCCHGHRNNATINWYWKRQNRRVTLHHASMTHRTV